MPLNERDEIDRLKLCISLTDASTAELRKLSGMDKGRFSKTLKKKIRLSSAELVALASYFPEYRFWIVFGEELPAAGQISPLTNFRG